MVTIAPRVVETEAAACAEQDQREVIGGVDTHKDTHTAAVIDTVGWSPRSTPTYSPATASAPTPPAN